VIILIMPLQILMGNPWVPDLIEEESQGMANAISGNVTTLAILLV